MTARRTGAGRMARRLPARRQSCLVADVVHGPGQRLGPRRRGIVLHRRHLGGEVHVGRGDAGLLGEPLLEPDRARSAGHAVNGQVAACIGHCCCASEPRPARLWRGRVGVGAHAHGPWRSVRDRLPRDTPDQFDEFLHHRGLFASSPCSAWLAQCPRWLRRRFWRPSGATPTAACWMMSARSGPLDHRGDAPHLPLDSLEVRGWPTRRRPHQRRAPGPTPSRAALWPAATPHPQQAGTPHRALPSRRSEFPLPRPQRLPLPAAACSFMSECS